LYSRRHVLHILLYAHIYEHTVYKEGVAVLSMHEWSPCLKGGAHFLPFTLGGAPLFKGDNMSIRKMWLSIPLYTTICLHHVLHILLYAQIYEHTVHKEGVAVPSMHEWSPCLKGGAHFLPFTQGGTSICLHHVLHLLIYAQIYEHTVHKEWV